MALSTSAGLAEEGSYRIVYFHNDTDTCSYDETLPQYSDFRLVAGNPEFVIFQHDTVTTPDCPLSSKSSLRTGRS